MSTWCSAAVGDAAGNPGDQPFTLEMSVRDYELDHYGVSARECIDMCSISFVRRSRRPAMPWLSDR